MRDVFEDVKAFNANKEEQALIAAHVLGIKIGVAEATRLINNQLANVFNNPDSYDPKATFLALLFVGDMANNNFDVAQHKFIETYPEATEIMQRFDRFLGENHE